MTSLVVLAVVWATLMFSTPLAVMVFRCTAVHGNDKQRLLLACGVLLLVVICAIEARISFSIQGANVIALVLAYGAYCFVAVSTWNIRHKLVRMALLVVVHVPVVLGYFFATAGFLGVMFTVGEMTAQPLVKEQLTSNLTCKIHSWGLVVTDSGYTVKLYKQWQLLPLVERAVYSVSVNVTASSDSDEVVDCHGALAAYQKNTAK